MKNNKKETPTSNLTVFRQTLSVALDETVAKTTDQFARLDDKGNVRVADVVDLSGAAIEVILECFLKHAAVLSVMLEDPKFLTAMGPTIFQALKDQETNYESLKEHYSGLFIEAVETQGEA